MNKKRSILFLGFATAIFAKVDKSVQYFPLNTVQLTESVFSKVMQADKNYIKL